MFPIQQDLHGEGNWHPVLDDSQDLKILGGYQNDTHTVLRFSRLWDTCDDWHDFHITVSRLDNLQSLGIV